MAGTGKRFKFHGAFKTKKDAVAKERNAACNSKCFVLPRRVRGSRRYLVLERR